MPRRLLPRIFPLVLLLGLPLVPTARAEEDLPFAEQVSRAIDRGTQWLRSRPKLFEIPDAEEPKGAHWGLIKGEKIYGGGTGKQYQHPAGPTALALYTLLKCDVSPKERVIQYGFNWLRQIHQVTEEWDAHSFGEGKVRHWTHTVAGSSYELSAMILALTALYDPHKESARSQEARLKGRLKIKNKEDRLWLQQMVTALVNRRGQPTPTPIPIDKSSMERFADPTKEEDVPEPPESERPERKDRLGWRYNTPNLNLAQVQVQKTSKGTRRNTDGAGRNVSVPPHANQDLSSTQLAALALYAAQPFGAKFDPSVWIDIAEFTLSHQETDGPDHQRHDPVLTSGGYAAPVDKARGFMYIRGSPDGTEGKATGSMTACGIANLLLAKDALSRTKKGQKLWKEAEIDHRVEKGIWDGLAWLDLNWSAFTNTKSSYGYHIYYLYAIERAQDLRGKELIGKHLWYREGALEILKRQQAAKVIDPTKRGAREKDGVFWMTNATHEPKDVLDTCFALLFLKRATKEMVPAPITPADQGPVDNR
jgi:hypothetical protein